LDEDPAGRAGRSLVVRVVCVVGTRPEVIKLAPVVAALRRRPGAECLVVATGQHREMLDQMLEQFELEADVDLNVMSPEQRLSDLTADLVRGLAATIVSLEPDWILVQGDTTTAFCGALAGFYEGVPVAHVEAGLRTSDERTPFPEEANRRLVARLATLHFCPTGLNAANLRAEGVPEDRILVTGNTVIDALLWAVEHARVLQYPVPSSRPRRILLTLHRRESHGEAMRSVCNAVRRLAARDDVEIVFPVHRSPAVRRVVLPELSGVEGVLLTEPLDYLLTVQALDSSELVLSDSGGLQEEAPALGKPVLVLRHSTERQEAVEAGNARLVGTDENAIVEAATELLDDPEAYAAMARPESPFGDGQASERIADALEQHTPGSPAT
jgi:UDP-N-acetylglucosamine 2-epimerase (non-hydrolysing)